MGQEPQRVWPDMPAPSTARALREAGPQPCTSWMPRRLRPRPCCPRLWKVLPPRDGRVTLSGHLNCLCPCGSSVTGSGHGPSVHPGSRHFPLTVLEPGGPRSRRPRAEVTCREDPLPGSSIFSLSPHRGKGWGALWGLFYKALAPSVRLHLRTQAPPDGPTSSHHHTGGQDFNM